MEVRVAVVRVVVRVEAAMEAATVVAVMVAVTVAVAMAEVMGVVVRVEAMEAAATAVVRATCLSTSVHAAARGARYANDFVFEVSSDAFVPDTHVWPGASRQHLSSQLLDRRFQRFMGGVIQPISNIGHH